MITRDDLPETPEWVSPVRDVPAPVEDLSIKPNIVLSDN